MIGLLTVDPLQVDTQGVRDSCAVLRRPFTDFPTVLSGSVDPSASGAPRAGEVLSAFLGERICLGVWMQARHRTTDNNKLQTADNSHARPTNLANLQPSTLTKHQDSICQPTSPTPPDALLSLHSSPPRTISTPSQPPFSRTWPCPAHRHYSSASLSPDMCRRRGSGSAGKTRHRGPVHAGVGLLRPSLGVEMIPQIR